MSAPDLLAGLMRAVEQAKARADRRAQAEAAVLFEAPAPGPLCGRTGTHLPHETTAGDCGGHVDTTAGLTPVRNTVRADEARRQMAEGGEGRG